MDFAENLQMLRKQHGLSQEQLAEKLAVSRQAVSKWESGRSTPDLQKIVILSNVFGVATDCLLKGDGPNEVPPDECVSRGKSHWMRYRLRYEYKSKKKLCGLPLVHIHFGTGFDVARGILAVGNVSVGVLSVGLLSLGALSVGLLPLGLIAFGNLAFGLLLSLGGIAVGTLAAGGIAIGIFSLGGLSLGMFSVGGIAIASHIAFGDYASAHLAIGHVARGAVTIVSHADNWSDLSAERVRGTIHEEYPHLWRLIADWLTLVLRW